MSDEKRTLILRRARDLALSGRYKDFLDIERALIAEGHPEARELLDRNSTREDLNFLCRRNYKGGANA